MKGRLCHNVMCPFLTPWRKAKAKEGEDNSESSDAILNDFFESLDEKHTRMEERSALPQGDVCAHC